MVSMRTILKDLGIRLYLFLHWFFIATYPTRKCIISVRILSWLMVELVCRHC